jgi:hypothetical protein
VSVPEFVPLSGETLSQLALGGETVHFNTLLPLFLMLTDCDATAAPAVPVAVTVVGVTESTCAEAVIEVMRIPARTTYMRAAKVLILINSPKSVDFSTNRDTAIHTPQQRRPEPKALSLSAPTCYGRRSVQLDALVNAGDAQTRHATYKIEIFTVLVRSERMMAKQ